jgi:hypothetical protein
MLFRNKLVESRNAQLEYKHTAVHLSEKIRKACTELSQKDTRVKEGMEVLSLERQRLGYLRDELARRADMISRWEQRTRQSGEIPPSVTATTAHQKDIDRMNALILEQEATRIVSAADPNLTGPRLTDPVSTPVPLMRAGTFVLDGASQTLPNPMSQEQVHLFDIAKGASPISVSVGSSGRHSPSSSAPLEVNADSPADKAPRPYPSWGYKEDEFLDDMTVCLDFLWSEYSTEVGDSERLMTLANLMRLVADATFAAPTQAVIEIFLRCVKLGSQHLIEKRFFLAVLQSVLQVTLQAEFDTIEITDVLFSEYLMPLMLRLKSHQRKLRFRNYSNFNRKQTLQRLQLHRLLFFALRF